MTDPHYTHIAFLLDRTGSMAPIRDDAIGGFNTLVADQRATPGKCTLTLVQFDSQDPQEIIHDTLPIDQVPELTEATYVPRAATPLLDAMGHLIVHTGQRLAALPEDQRPGKVNVAILTDGLENASQEYTKPRILEMVRHQREAYGWQFLFLGADQDAIAEAGGYGISAGLAMSIGKTGRGTHEAMKATSDVVRHMRMSLDEEALKGVAFSTQARMIQAEEIEKQKTGA